MNEAGRQQVCPRCSVPGVEQHHMKRLHINFTESVDMCPNTKCLWMQLVSTDSGTDSQTRLPGPGGSGDEFNHLLSSLWEPSVDSGVDADGSVSSWEPVSSDAGSLCSELAGVGLSSVASESGGGRWRPASAPAGPRTTPGSLPADTRSEPDLAARMRAARRARLTDHRPQSGLSLRNFNNSETRLLQRTRRESRSAQQKPARQRSSQKGLYSSPAAAVFRRPLPPWERAALRQSLTQDPFSELLFAGDPTGRRRHRQSVARKLKRAERLDKQATAATTTALKRASAAANCAAASAAVAATSARGAAATTATTSASDVPAAAAAAASSAAPESPLGPAPATEPAGPAEPRPVFLPPARHVKVRTATASEVAARLDRELAAPELRQLCCALNTDQVFVRSRQVKRVRAWARKKTGAAGL